MADSTATTREQALNRAAFDRWQVFCESSPGQALLFLWAVAEAIFWPIIPDALLIPMAAAGRRKYWPILGAAVLGSALGGIVIYLFAYIAPSSAGGFLIRLPLVQDFMIEGASAALDQQGVVAFWTQPWSGISYKIYAVLAGAGGLNPLVVLPISIVARTLRMLIASGVAAVVVGRFPNFFRNYWLYAVLAYVVIFGYGWWQLST